MYSRYYFTISAIQAYDSEVPNKRCPVTGKMKTIEHAFEECFPVAIEDMTGIQSMAQHAYGDQKLDCFVSRDFLFIAIGDKIVRVMPFNPAYEYGFHPYAIQNFEQHVNPRLVRDGIELNLLTDYLKAKPFNIAERNQKIVRSVKRHHNIDDCHFVATKHCIYVLKGTEVIRCFLYYAADYNEDEFFTFRKHAKDRALEHFGHLIKTNVNYWLCQRIHQAKEDKRIYNNSAFIADVAQAYPDVDAKFLIDEQFDIVFVVNRDNNHVLTVQPRERDWFRPNNHRVKKAKKQHRRPGLKSRPHSATPYDRNKERSMDFRKQY
ncbi:hypothetical protein J4N45_10875 [Vibrio sp. SCSIO 43140]|uniref:hypothetical protein n=1 Tax=Vibrio sp. SCSIO 43140 TaxID=2819100 RepID=UPI0020754837|nr:hypothetical protein [Vibrio sp. SCSIO 43140]USD59033.1 hypothetical protein J4N45_10875 [Vibrio sp. SCSIO 43140]